MAMELDPGRLRRHRRAVPHERNAGQHDVTKVEGLVDRPDPEAGRVVLGLEARDEARFSRYVSTADIVDGDGRIRGARAAAAVAARERHVIDAGLRRSRRPREDAGIVTLIRERGPAGDRARREGDMIAVLRSSGDWE